MTAVSQPCHVKRVPVHKVVTRNGVGLRKFCPKGQRLLCPKGRRNISLEGLSFMKGQKFLQRDLAFGEKPENERILLVTYHAFTHIALFVTPLRQAEEFYRALFALDVAFREAETADGWYTLPPDASWDDAEAAGISLGLCSLHRDAFTLALEEGASSSGGRLSHVGVQVDEEDLERLRTMAPTLG